MSMTNSVRAFELLIQSAREYNDSEYKFYNKGFFKFKREGDKTFLIEDIYVEPEYRGTPVSQMILSDFNDFMKIQGILMYYGYVHRGNGQARRLNKFKAWGMELQDVESLEYVIVSKQVEY